MLTCTINGNIVYPEMTSNIKVTYSNPYVTDSGTYTYDINFPMSIADNKMFFGHVDRFEVRKKITSYDMVNLYSDNRLIASGKGVVTGITNEKVQIQLTGGKSKIKYNSKFESVYIDEIDDYEDVKSYTLAHQVPNDTVPGRSWSGMTSPFGPLVFDPSKDCIMGEWGKFSFNSIYDETNNVYSNSILPFKQSDGTYHYAVLGLAVQPWLFYVLKIILQHEGYTLFENDFDQAPWNQLVIASAVKTLTIKAALPHWTIYTFLDNVSKFFNGTFFFDEGQRKVKFVAQNELMTKGVVHYDVVDDFSMEHEDDDGLQTTATQNLKYDFPDSENRSWKEIISSDILKTYPLACYNTITDMKTAADKMTARTRQQTIFKVKDTYYVYGYDDNDLENNNEICYEVGYFSPVIRNANSDDYEDIEIVPVAMAVLNRWDADKTWSEDAKFKSYKNIEQGVYNTWFVPSIVNGSNVTDNDVTVKEAMEGADINTNKTSDDTVQMQVMFQSKSIVDIKNNIKQPNPTPIVNGAVYQPLVYTDYRQLSYYTDNDKSSVNASLSLKDNSEGAIGHYVSTYTIDQNSQITIKLLTKEIPDPSYIYIIHNKKYICAKIEINISDSGIDDIKTGYFYQLV